jgi:gamma-butyrobetaine dioxygenase
MAPGDQVWEPGDYPASWLRANCQCAACVDPGSGQRLASVTDVSAGVRVAGVTPDPQDDGAVHVTFEPDGHQGVFARSWLAAARQPAPDSRTEDSKRLWRAADFAANMPHGHWERYLRDAGHRAACLTAVLTYGFVLLREVPASPGAVLAVARSMGFVRETNYGQLFDVRTIVDPANLAYSALAISPHTDNPYRDPVPTVQLLHCLASAAQGGDSGLVDGFTAASELRAEDPAAFAVLARTPVTFRYADATAELHAAKPIIGLDPRGRISQVRWNSRSMQPLALGGTRPGTQPGSAVPEDSESAAAAAAEADAFYGACRAFAHVLARPELMVTFRLAPGDCVIFDNTRVLHARTAFDAAPAQGEPETPAAAPGHRHLQGCYTDLDGVESTLAVLRRRIGPQASGPEASSHNLDACQRI